MNIDKVLRENLTLEMIDEKYKHLAELIGIKSLLALAEYVNGDEIYIPKVERLLIPLRNLNIKEEFTGYNHAELGKKYNLTVSQIKNIVGEGWLEGQISIFDTIDSANTFRKSS